MTDVSTYAELLANYEKERSDPQWHPIHLGFGTIDTELRGISMGQVLLIAARSGVGKTFLLESIEHNFAARTDAGQLSLSLEMPGGEWAERALAIHTDVSPEQVERWAIRRELAEHAGPFLDRMARSLVIEKAVALGDLSNAVNAAREKLAVPIRLVTIDYMGLLMAPGATAYERTSAIAKEIKAFAKREEIAVILASQLSRAGGSGEIAVTLDMLRDSGVVEESGDFILGCWRPGIGMTRETRETMTKEEIAEAMDLMVAGILKNRKGAIGRHVDLRFHAESRRLYEVADPFQQLSETGGMHP